MLVPLVLQNDTYSCGASCAIMVASYYSGSIVPPDQQEAIRHSCLGKRGYTSQNRLIAAVRELGLSVGIRRNATIDTYRKAFYYQRPVIVYHETGEHWMVGVAESNGLIICNDPQSPIQTRYNPEQLSDTLLVIRSKT